MENGYWLLSNLLISNYNWERQGEFKSVLNYISLNGLRCDSGYIQEISLSMLCYLGGNKRVSHNSKCGDELISALIHSLMRLVEKGDFLIQSLAMKNLMLVLFNISENENLSKSEENIFTRSPSSVHERDLRDAEEGYEKEVKYRGNEWRRFNLMVRLARWGRQGQGLAEVLNVLETDMESDIEYIISDDIYLLSVGSIIICDRLEDGRILGIIYKLLSRMRDEENIIVNEHTFLLILHTLHTIIAQLPQLSLSILQLLISNSNLHFIYLQHKIITLLTDCLGVLDDLEVETVENLGGENIPCNIFQTIYMIYLQLLNMPSFSSLHPKPQSIQIFLRIISNPKLLTLSLFKQLIFLFSSISLYHPISPSHITHLLHIIHTHISYNYNLTKFDEKIIILEINILLGVQNLAKHHDLDRNSAQEFTRFICAGMAKTGSQQEESKTNNISKINNVRIKTLEVLTKDPGGNMREIIIDSGIFQSLCEVGLYIHIIYIYIYISSYAYLL